MRVENVPLRTGDLTPIEECDGGVGATDDAQLSPPWFAPSSNGCGVAGQDLDTETLSQMLAPPSLQGEVLRWTSPSPDRN